MVMPVSHPVVQFACVWILSSLTFLYNPADSPTEPIAAAAKFFQDNHFPANQLGIQFIQVGNDPGAAAFLDTLDRGEGLGLARDIVDTMRSNGKDLHGDVLVKALVGAINRKLDKDGEPKEKKK
jgi:hypothetical protein